MKLYIKNMVCQRCVAAVRSILEEEGLEPEKIVLGEVEINKKFIPEKKVSRLNKKFIAAGFEIIDNNKSRIIEKIRNIIIEKIHYGSINPDTNWSDYLTSLLPYEYKYLSQLFSSVEGITIEHYIISQKVEKAKELIVYDELSLSEIAFKMGYSSIPHFSSQFKKTTGMTPSAFKKLTSPVRKSIDEV